MPLMLLRTFPDPVLARTAVPVTVFDDRLADLVAEMTRVMLAHGGIGLAAPQVGVSERVVVFLDEDGTPRHIVNPSLGQRSLEQELGEEGCLSLPGVYAAVSRPCGVSGSGFDADGAPLRFTAQGLLARCLQHEVDHLDGVLFIDRLDRYERERVLAAYAEQFVVPVLRHGPSHHR